LKLKTLIVLLCLSISLGVMGPQALAQNNGLAGVNIDYENDLGHEGRTLEEIINELVNDGITLEDATFYAKIEILAVQLTKQGIELNLKNVKEYSDLYVKANKKEIREKALQLDKAALKALIKRNAAMIFGKKDIEKVQKINKLGKKRKNYEVKYPDGTVFNFYMSDVKDNENSDIVDTNTQLSGPWDEDDTFYASNFTDEDGGNWTSTRVWDYNAGVSVAKVKDILKWSYGGIGDTTIDFTSDTGASSYGGVVKIDIEYLSNNQSGNNAYGEHVLQGYTDVRFTVDGSFQSTFGALTIAVDVGAGWHQYCITEIVLFSSSTGSIGAYGYAGQFL
jgi:hypothetical protein